MIVKDSHILVICAEGIGNTLLTLPALQALKDRGNRLDIVVADNGSAEIVDRVNIAERVFVWRSSHHWLWNCMRLGVSFCCHRYDHAYAACPAGKKANVLLRMVHAKQKHGWRSVSGKKLLEYTGFHITDWDERVHDLNSNENLMKLNGSEIDQALNQIKIKLGARGNEDNRPLERVKKLGVQPFSINQAKEWPAKKYEELLSRWTKESEFEVTLFGSEADREKLETMKRTLPFPVQLKISLLWPELIETITTMDFFLGIDSSLCHLSALLNVPTCILYGLTVPERTIALGKHVLAVQTDYSCCPCYKYADGFIEDCSYHFRCLHCLDAGDVFDIVQGFWESQENNSSNFVCEKLKCSYRLKEMPFGARLLTIGGRDAGSFIEK